MEVSGIVANRGTGSGRSRCASPSFCGYRKHCRSADSADRSAHRLQPSQRWFHRIHEARRISFLRPPMRRQISRFFRPPENIIVHLDGAPCPGFERLFKIHLLQECVSICDLGTRYVLIGVVHYSVSKIHSPSIRRPTRAGLSYPFWVNFRTEPCRSIRRTTSCTSRSFSPDTASYKYVREGFPLDSIFIRIQLSLGTLRIKNFHVGELTACTEMRHFRRMANAAARLDHTENHLPLYHRELVEPFNSLGRVSNHRNLEYHAVSSNNTAVAAMIR